MLKLNWKEYKINLEDFHVFLKQNVPNSDGIYADPNEMIIHSKVNFTDVEISLIQQYYDSMPEYTNG